MRVGVLNVHIWSDARSRSNVDAVIELLGSLDCDVVTLHEVLRDGPQLDRVARALSMRYELGAAAWLGNAVLSRHPIERVETHEITASYEEGRCVVCATIAAPDGAFDVCATHLDPMYEQTRLDELARLEAALSKRAGAHLVTGDFNALRLTDYNGSALADVRSKRARADREEPRGDVIARLDALGYFDAYRLARAGHVGEYREALLRPLPVAECSTCWVGTRIDYVWASPAMLDRYAVTAARHVPTECTDHAAVVVEFAPAAH